MPIQAIEGVQIYVLSDTGRFEAEIAGKRVQRAALRDLERLIRGQKQPITAYRLNATGWGALDVPEPVQVIGFDRQNVALGPSGGRVVKLGTLYLPLPADLDELRSIAAAEAILRDRWRTIVARTRYLDKSTLDELQAALPAADEATP